MAKYLVTGAAGFIGSNICDHLISTGHTVVGIDNLSNGALINISHLSSDSRFSFLEGDITSLEFCQAACKGVDIVLHQAALGSVPRSMKFPELYEQNNAAGTLNIFIAARDQNVKRVVYASSSSVYGDTPVLPKVETMPTNPLSPYAVTKYSNELYGSVFFKAYGLETVGLRYFNIFGPRQSPTSQYAAVIPKFIHAIQAYEPVTIHGDGLQTRDFTYVENAIAANLAAANAPVAACGQAYNIGCGAQISLLDLVNQIATILKTKPTLIHTETRAGDIKDSLADIQKAKTMLGYFPQVNLSAGLEETIRWFQNLQTKAR